MGPVGLSVLGICRSAGPPPALPRNALGILKHLLMLCLPSAGLLAQGQYDLDPLPPFPDHIQYTHYSDQIGKALFHPLATPGPFRPPQPCHVIKAWLLRGAWLSWGPGGVG